MSTVRATSVLEAGNAGRRASSFTDPGPVMKRNLILSGGAAHDYEKTSAMLADLLMDAQIESETLTDLGQLTERPLIDYDMITVNCARWTCSQSQVKPEWRDHWAFEIPEAARRGLLGFLAKRRGLLALHAATLCFDDWPEYREILGAWWEWGRSGHAPFGRHAMHVRTGAHPITRGVHDFIIDDELYTEPRLQDSVFPLIEAEWEGRRHPILWVRGYGEARVCYNALGHGPEAFEHPVNRTVLQRCAHWLLRQLD
jgi:type 1 glutamine amidotransferase